MKTPAVKVCALVVAALILASVAPLLAAGKTHEMKGEVVSVDLTGKMLTFKDEKGENKTAPVLGNAADMLKTLKAGDKITLTCQDNEKGEHQGISAIKMAKGATK